MNEEQKTVMYALVGQALDDAGGSADDNKEGDEEEMKHNVFDKEEMQQTNVLSHSDEEAIVELAKQSNVGSLKMAMQIYAEEMVVISRTVYSRMLILRNYSQSTSCLKKVNLRHWKETRVGSQQQSLRFINLHIAVFVQDRRMLELLS